MMSTAELRNKFVEYIHTADNGMLQRIEDVIQSYSVENSESVLTPEQKQTLDSRLAKHAENPETGRSWSEVKEELSAKYGV